MRRADPLLMGAAFAYNALFALVPLSLAFVSMLTMFDSTLQMLDQLYAFAEATLPEDLANFLIRIMTDSVDVLNSNRVVIVLVTTIVALWSGSRAVYAVQKALRLMESTGDDVSAGYIRMRTTAVLVTIGAGIAVIVGYVLFIVGLGIVDKLGRSVQILVQLGMVTLTVVWLFALIYVVYRWGAPEPIVWPATTAILVAVLIAVGSAAALKVFPTNVVGSVAVFGSIGLVLLWLYGVGIVVVGGPIVVASLIKVLETKSRR